MSKSADEPELQCLRGRFTWQTPQDVKSPGNKKITYPISSAPAAYVHYEFSPRVLQTQHRHIPHFCSRSWPPLSLGNTCVSILIILQTGKLRPRESKEDTGTHSANDKRTLGFLTWKATSNQGWDGSVDRVAAHSANRAQGTIPVYLSHSKMFPPPLALHICYKPVRGESSL